MRSTMNTQLHLGEVDVTNIYITPRSRDDIQWWVKHRILFLKEYCANSHLLH